ncbi:MAG: hypothetical protein LBR25_02410, partial [Erysipelotrichaceae bacterium]|nr:hypothetical protein [Erysipelotrichaceae bacterium]
MRKKIQRLVITFLVAVSAVFATAVPMRAASSNPQFTKQPTVSNTYAKSATMRLYVQATSVDGGYLTYQWKYSTSSNKSSPVNVTGTSGSGTMATLTATTPSTAGTYYYWVEVTNHSNGTTAVIDSSLATVVVVNRTLKTSIMYGDFEAYSVSSENAVSSFNPTSGYWNTTHDGTVNDTLSGYTGSSSRPKKVLEVGNQSWYGTFDNNNTKMLELSAFAPSTVYQELATVPGKIYEWSIDHAARVKGMTTSPQVMAIVIGPAINTSADYAAFGISTNRWINDSSAPPDNVYPYGKNYTTYFYDIVKALADQEGVTMQDLRTLAPGGYTYTVQYGNNKYYVYISSAAQNGHFENRTGSYSIPEGQGTTVFGFLPITTDSGVGNLLDNITFSSGSTGAGSQKITYEGDSTIYIENTKTDYAYALAEVRGSSIYALQEKDVYFTPTSGSESSISADGAVGDGVSWYYPNATGTLTFKNLVPGKTYRVIGIPIAAISASLGTNLSAASVLDDGYYTDITIDAAKSSSDDDGIANISTSLYDDSGQYKGKLTLLTTDSRAQYALLDENGYPLDVNGEPLTLQANGDDSGVNWVNGN